MTLKELQELEQKKDKEARAKSAARKISKQEESILQTNCVYWFRLQYPKAIIYHIPNGEYRDVKTGAKLKRMGVLAGIPDLHIPIAARGYHSLYIEMKTGTGRVEKRTQGSLMEKLEMEGNLCKVVRTASEFQDLVNWYFEGIYK